MSTRRGDFLFENELDRKYRRIGSGLTADFLAFYIPPTLATIPIYLGTLLFLTPLFALPIQFMGIPLTNRKARPIIFLMECLYIGAVFLAYWQLDNFGPLMPLP